MREKLAKALRELDVPQVTDPFREMPTYAGSIAYFRLHGLEAKMYYYQYTDEELKRVYELVRPLEKEGRGVYVLFNNLSMFDDGLRFMHYLETGCFPSLTEEAGLESVKSVITRTRYPVTKGVLLNKLGWRLVEVEEGKQVRLGELLKDIPSKAYKDVKEVLREIRL